MPGKNIIKTYVENGYYHLYNRGIDRREIFLEPKDCITFLYYLKLYLSSPETLQKANLFITPRMLYKITVLNLYNEVHLLSFALMPNHFHLQVKQLSVDGIEKLMRRVLTSYAGFFNTKYTRRGPLFESIYKAVLIESEPQHLYLSSYIHRNPMKLQRPKFDFIQFSSYPYYLLEKRAEWVRQEEILSYFKTAKGKNDIVSYQNFVESILEQPETILGERTLEVD